MRDKDSSGASAKVESPVGRCRVGGHEGGTGDEINPDVLVHVFPGWYAPVRPLSIVALGPTSSKDEQVVEDAEGNPLTEYWELDDDFLTELGSANPGDTLRLQATVREEDPPPAPFTNPTDTLWALLPSASGPAGTLFVTDTSTSPPLPWYGLAFDLTAGSPWRGTVTWYVCTGASGPPPYIIGPTTDMTVSCQSSLPAPPADNYWWYVTLPALTWPSAPWNPGEGAVGVAVTVQGSNYLLADVTTDTSPTVNVRSSTDGVTWGDPASISIGTPTGGPAIVPLAGTSSLYLFTSEGSEVLQYVSTDGGVSWSGPSSPLSATNGSPAAATAAISSVETLCLGFPVANGSATSLQTMTTTDGSTWSRAVDTGIADAVGSPALAGLKSELFLAVAVTDGTNPDPVRIVVYKSEDGLEGWSLTAEIAPPSSSGATWSNPALAVYGENLALTFMDDEDSVWICFSADGVSWTGYQNLTLQIPTLTTDVAPAVVTQGAQIVIGANAVNTERTGLSTVATITPRVTAPAR